MRLRKKKTEEILDSYILREFRAREKILKKKTDYIR